MKLIAIAGVLAVLGTFAAIGKTSQNTSRPPEYQPKPSERLSAPRVMQTVTCTPTPPPTPPGGNPKKK